MPGVDIRYFGNAAFQITSEKGIRILIDPCITGHKGLGVSPVSLDEITDIDLILVSHGSMDHLGDTLELASRFGCKVMCGPDVALHLTRQGLEAENVFRLVWGMEVDFKGVRVRCVESRHISFIISDDYALSGISLGFIIYTESGLGIYHPGDTSIFREVELFAQLYHPQIGLLPVGDFAAFPGYVELSPREAALMAKWMQLELVIPMHYTQGSRHPHDFADFACREAPNTRVAVMNPGEILTYPG